MGQYYNGQRNTRERKGYDRDKARYDGRFKGNGNGRHQGHGHGKPKAPPMKMTPDEGQKPAYEVSIGRVRVTVWINEGEHGPYYLVNVACRFLDQQGVRKGVEQGVLHAQEGGA